jgi:hypothetical protein
VQQRRYGTFESYIRTHHSSNHWMVVVLLTFCINGFNPLHPRVQLFISEFKSATDFMQNASFTTLMNSRYAFPMDLAKLIAGITAAFVRDPSLFLPPLDRLPSWSGEGLGIQPYVRSAFERICFPRQQSS